MGGVGSVRSPVNARGRPIIVIVMNHASNASLPHGSQAVFFLAALQTKYHGQVGLPEKEWLMGASSSCPNAIDLPTKHTSEIGAKMSSQISDKVVAFAQGRPRPARSCIVQVVEQNRKLVSHWSC